jgi:hypothetical protein
LAKRIGPHLVSALSALPGCIREDGGCDGYDRYPPFNLAQATLLRGCELLLPSAQAIAAYVTPLLETPIPVLSAEELSHSSSAIHSAFVEFPKLGDQTPLWYYILRESELLSGGHCLGPLGSRIVAETLHAAVSASENSILADPSWKPLLPCHNNKHFMMHDLIAFTGCPDPLGTYHDLLSGG